MPQPGTEDLRRPFRVTARSAELTTTSTVYSLNEKKLRRVVRNFARPWGHTSPLLEISIVPVQVEDQENPLTQTDTACFNGNSNGDPRPTHKENSTMSKFAPTKYDPRADSSPAELASAYWAIEGDDQPADNPGFYPSSTVILVRTAREAKPGAEAVEAVEGSPAVKADAEKGIEARAAVKAVKGKPATAAVLQLSCACGCGQYPKSLDRHFVMGHDARLKGALIRAHLMGVEVAIADPTGLTSSDALTVAKQFVWERFLLNAGAKMEAKAAAKTEREAARKAKAEAKAKAVKVGDSRNITVRGTEYEGVVTFVNGDEVQIGYTTKDGKEKVLKTTATKLAEEAAA